MTPVKRMSKCSVPEPGATTDQGSSVYGSADMDTTLPTRHPTVVGVFGESGVGKTSFLSMFMKGDTEALGSTKSISSVEMKASPDTSMVTMEVGQSATKALHCCDAFIVMYSVQTKSSLEKAITICQHITSTRESKHCPVVIVGNKADLDGMDVITRRSLVDRKLGCKHMTVSAKLNQNVKPVFQYLLDRTSIPSSCVKLTNKVEAQQSTGDQCKVSQTGNRSPRARSYTLSCTKSEHLPIRRKSRSVDGIHMSPKPVSRDLLEYGHDESDKTSESGGDTWDDVPSKKLLTEQLSSEYSGILDINTDSESGRFSSFDSGYRSVSTTLPDVTTQRHKADIVGSTGLQRSKSAKFNSNDLRRSVLIRQLFKSESLSSINVNTPAYDATSDLKIPGNTNICYLNASDNYTKETDKTPPPDKSALDRLRSDSGIRPGINCNIPLNEAEISSLRGRGFQKGCSIM